MTAGDVAGGCVASLVEHRLLLVAALVPRRIAAQVAPPDIAAARRPIRPIKSSIPASSRYHHSRCVLLGHLVAGRRAAAAAPSAGARPAPATAAAISAGRRRPDRTPPGRRWPRPRSASRRQPVPGPHLVEPCSSSSSTSPPSSSSGTPAARRGHRHPRPAPASAADSGVAHLADGQPRRPVLEGGQVRTSWCTNGRKTGFIARSLHDRSTSTSTAATRPRADRRSTSAGAPSSKRASTAGVGGRRHAPVAVDRARGEVAAARRAERLEDRVAVLEAAEPRRRRRACGRPRSPSAPGSSAAPCGHDARAPATTSRPPPRSTNRAAGAASARRRAARRSRSPPGRGRGRRRTARRRSTRGHLEARRVADGQRARQVGARRRAPAGADQQHRDRLRLGDSTKWKALSAAARRRRRAPCRACSAGVTVTGANDADADACGADVSVLRLHDAAVELERQRDAGGRLAAAVGHAGGDATRS